MLETPGKDAVLSVPRQALLGTRLAFDCRMSVVLLPHHMRRPWFGFSVDYPPVEQSVLHLVMMSVWLTDSKLPFGEYSSKSLSSSKSVSKVSVA